MKGESDSEVLPFLFSLLRLPLMIEACHPLHLHLEVGDRWEMYPQDLRSQVHKDEQKPSGLWNFGVTLILLFARWTRPAMLMFSHMQAFNENEYPQK